MAYSEDYRELIENARDAMRELLKKSEPDSWLGLRNSYAEIRRALNVDDGLIERLRKRTEQEERRTLSTTHDGDRERREEAAIWKSVSKVERERVAIEMIGEGRLTLTELTHKFQEHFGFDGTIYHSQIRPIAMRLLAAGELQREAEDFQGKVRYRWFRRRGLDGPIADLERAYHDDEEAA